MTRDRWMARTERWLRLLVRLYPVDFREEVGEAVVEAYRDRAGEALRRGGVGALAGVWLRALTDSLWNGLGERFRPGIAWRRSGNWGRDTELAVRRLSRAPGFVAALAATLTVGLGAFAVVYAVVDKVLLEPLPYEKPDDLYFVWRQYHTMELDRGSLAGTDLAALGRAGGVIEGAAPLNRYTATLESGGEPEEQVVLATSPELFGLLGVRPLLGRGFAPEEVGPGRPPVVVLGHDLWRGRFNGDSALVGRTIVLDGVPHTVIGVMGSEFELLQFGDLGAPEGAALYTTVTEDLAATSPSAGSYSGVIRVRSGTPQEAVAAAVAAVGRQVNERDFGGRNLISLYPVGMQDDLVSRVRPALVVLAFAAGFLVLVLLVNIATLLLARAAGREQEFAISRALGANGVAVARAMVLEGALLGTLGGVGAALAARWGTQLLAAVAPLELPRRDAIALDWGAALLVLLLGVMLGILAGVLPALYATRSSLAALMGAANVRGGGGGHGRLRRGMVVVQVALSLVLLSAGGLVVRSFQELLRARPGFDPAGVLTFRVSASEDRYPDEAAVNALHARLQAELASIPGVQAVGATTSLPLTSDTQQMEAEFPGAPGNTGDPDRDLPLVDLQRVRPGFFETLRIPMLAGHGFVADAVAPGLIEVVIDRTLAGRFFSGADPIGQRVRVAGLDGTVVGVAGHARMYDVHRDDRFQAYIRNDALPRRTLSFVVRSERPPLEMGLTARAAVRRVDRSLAVADIRPMQAIIDESLRQPRISAVLIGGFSVAALLLAAVGLYGVVAGAVTRRRHELAVRMALGSTGARAIGLVVGDGARLVVIGFLLGAPGVILAGRAVRSTLVGVSAYEPVTLASVAAGLLLVALAACWLPARRVAGIEPAQSLRQD